MDYTYDVGTFRPIFEENFTWISGFLRNVRRFGNNPALMGLATGKAADATARQPEASGKIQSILVLGLALTESCAIYGFVSALIVIFTLA